MHELFWRFLDTEDDADDETEDEDWWYCCQSPWHDKNEVLPQLWQRVFIVIANGTVYNTVYCGEKAQDWRFGKSDILYWMPEPDTSGLAGVSGTN